MTQKQRISPTWVDGRRSGDSFYLMPGLERSRAHNVGAHVLYPDTVDCSATPIYLNFLAPFDTSMFYIPLYASASYRFLKVRYLFK